MWRQQYDRIRRQRGKVSENRTIVRHYAVQYTKLDERQVDDVLSCISHIHHFKDWLISCKCITKEEANAYLDKNDELKICQDLCNGAKHLTSKFREQGGYLSTEQLPAPAVFKGTHQDVEYIQVVYIEEGKYNALALIDKSISLWEELLQRRGLL